MADWEVARLQEGDVVAKRFEVDAPLGAGPCGASYRAHALDGGGRVVLKLLAGPASPESQAQELLRRLWRVGNDRVIVPTETGELRGHRWVVMPEAGGDSLRRLMDDYAGQKKPFALQEACQLMAQVLEGASAAHERGLIHRHVKVTNVVVHTRLVDRRRVVRSACLTGLGISELVHPGVLQEGLCERPGDTRYMAPELSSPSEGGSPPSDVYSAGVIFYELLCGQTPMGTYLSPSQIREDLPKHVDDIVDIAIAANAEDRYPTARDMINDLERTFRAPWWKIW